MATRPVPTMESGLAIQPAPVVPASGTRATAQVLGQSAGAMDQFRAQLQERRSQDDVIARTRDFAAVDGLAKQELLRLETEADISDPAVVQSYRDYLDNLYTQAVDTHAGSGDSQARLAARLMESRSSLVDNLSIKSILVGRQRVQDEFGTRVNSIAARASDDPEQIENALIDLNDLVDDMSPAFGPQRAAENLRFGQAEILKSAVTGLVDRGAFDLAEQIMVTRPEVAEALDPGEYRTMRSRISAARMQENSLEREVSQREALLGRRLTQGELMQVLGMGGGAAEPLEVIADETSPTGTRFVPRSQAVGQPAPQKSPLVEIDMGAKHGPVQPGMVRVEDPTTPSGFRDVPVTGGPAEIEAQREAIRTQAASEDDATKARFMTRDLDRSIALIDAGAGGAQAAVTSLVPGTDSFQLERTLDGIKARVGFDSLQKMRQSSPTGGALGAISERENILLQSLLGSLDVRQDRQVLRENLVAIRELQLDALYGSPAEHEAAIAEGRLTEEQAAQLSQERQTIGLKAVGAGEAEEAAPAAESAGGAQAADGQITATNPQTGERRVWTTGGGWVPMEAASK